MQKYRCISHRSQGLFNHIICMEHMLHVQLCLTLCDPMDCSPPWFHITSTDKEKSSSIFILVMASFMAQLVKNLPAMQETWVQSVGWEDPQEKGKDIHSNILSWRIPWTTVLGIAKSQTRLSNFHFSLSASPSV